MSVYFLCIGVGYIFIQIGLLQRLIVLLGHPTHALSVVLFSMLLGTAAGSAVGGALFTPRWFPFAWSAIAAVLLILILVLAPAAQWILAIRAPLGRSLACSTIVAIPAFALGFGFPLGMKLVYGAGESAVQMMWAINGAASIAGAALGAILGIAFGNHVVLWAGLLFYLLATLMGIRALKVSTLSSIGSS